MGEPEPSIDFDCINCGVHGHYMYFDCESKTWLCKICGSIYSIERSRFSIFGEYHWEYRGVQRDLIDPSAEFEYILECPYCGDETSQEMYERPYAYCSCCGSDYNAITGEEMGYDEDLRVEWEEENDRS